MADVFLKDGHSYSRYYSEVGYPLDWGKVAEYEAKPQLVITLSVEETREILATLESATQGKYSSGGSASATLSVSASHYFYRAGAYYKEAHYSSSLDAFVLRAKSYDAARETLPNEWVMYERKELHGYSYWNEVCSNPVSAHV